MPAKPPIPDFREMMRTLIAAPSVSSVSPAFDMSNREVATQIAEWLESIGCAVELQELDD